MKLPADLLQANQRLESRVLELTSDNETLGRELAEQKRIVDELRRNELRLRSLAAISVDWDWEQDANYRFLEFVDEKGFDKWGPVWDGSTGKCRWELSGAVPLSMSWEAHRAMLDARLPFRDFEYMRVLGDGSPRYFSANGVPLFDSQNRFTGYRGTARDISVSKRTEEAERKTARLLDDIVDNIPVGVHLKSVQPGFPVVTWNKAAEEIYGLPREEAIGRTVYEIWPKEDADRMHAADLALIEGGVMQDFPERAAYTRHRGVIHVHMRKILLRDASGAVTHILITAEDITGRLEASDRLQRSEARFRAVVGAMAEGVLLRDADGKIIDCNASAERILGRTLADIKGHVSVTMGWQTLREDGTLIPEDQRPAFTARRTGLSQSNVVMCCNKPDGSVLWGMTNVRPLFDSTSGTPSGFVSTITDITQRKLAEMEIVRLNVELENRVLRRTAQLEAANRELEAFSYSVAHDLRSPLSSIDGFSSLLGKMLPPGQSERAGHYIHRIRSGVQRMGELIDGLLMLARLSRTSISWQSVNLSAEVLTIVRNCSETDASRQVRVTVEPDMMVQADSALLRQVLENLISNAWKFTSRKPDAEISIGKQTGADQQPVYFVRDNGAGFDMQYADKLFGTFQRLHSPGEFAGSGIGLATVRRIITRHGGSIWAQSAIGEGTTFYFTLGSEHGTAAGSDHPDVQLPSELERSSPPEPLSPGAAADIASLPGDGRFIAVRADGLTFADQQFSYAFEHAAIGMAVITLESRRLRVNRAFCEMLGYSEAEMISPTSHHATHPDDIGWDKAQRKRALAGEIESYQWEKRYIHKAGHIVWGYLTASLVRDADRKPLHFIVQIQDITIQKRNQRTLRQSEERFRALTELSSDWFWELDENFRFVQISGAMGGAPSDINGNQEVRSRLVGKTRWELNYVNMDDTVWAAHRAQLERHEVFRDFEVTRLGSDGQIQYRSISGVPIFDEAGRFTGYRGVGRNITEMRRITEALRLSESQLRDITDTVPAMIAYLDAGQHFRFHNKAYEEVFGLTFEQLEGMHLREVAGERLYETVRAHVEEVLAGYPVAYERTHKRAVGDQRDYVVNYFPRYGSGTEEGQVIGFYSLSSDVTELKRNDRMQTEFVSRLSRELHAPLASICELLEQISVSGAGFLPDDAQALLALAKKDCDRLVHLIRDDFLDARQLK